MARSHSPARLSASDPAAASGSTTAAPALSRRALVGAAALGTAAIGMGLAGCGAPWSAPRTRAVGMEEFPVAALGLGRVEIAGRADDVSLEPCGGAALRVEEYSSRTEARYRARIAVVDGTLRVEEGEAPQGSYVRHLKLYLPAAFTGTVAVATQSGSVSLDADGLELAEVRIDTGSGPIALARVRSGNIGATAASGNVAMSDIESTGGLAARTVSGNVALDGISVEDDLAAGTVSGAVRLSDAAAHGDLAAASASGVVRLVRTTAGGDLAASSETGGVELDDAAADGAADVRTTSGRLSASDLRAASVAATSTSGTIRLSGVSAETALDVRSASGAVDLVLDPGLAFELTARSASGAVRVNVAGAEGARGGDGAAVFSRGGSRPSGLVCTVTVETGSGSIDVA